MDPRLDVGGRCWAVPVIETVLEGPPGVHPVFEHEATQLLERMLDELAAITGDTRRHDRMTDCHRVDQLRLLEQLKGAAAAAQARITVEFEASQLTRQDDEGVRPEQRGRASATKWRWPGGARRRRDHGTSGSPRR